MDDKTTANGGKRIMGTLFGPSEHSSVKEPSVSTAFRTEPEGRYVYCWNIRRGVGRKARVALGQSATSLAFPEEFYWMR